MIPLLPYLIETCLQHLHLRRLLDKVRGLPLQIILGVRVTLSVLSRLILTLSQVVLGVVKIWVLGPVGSLAHHIIFEVDLEGIKRRTVVVNELGSSIV